MLKMLKIENIAVIEKAQIEFSNGLNVLTGETGAGKSIVVDAINAILGERTSRELVRSNCEFAYVSAYFENVCSEAFEILDDLGLEKSNDGSILITRKIYANGKSTCKVDGLTVTVSMLKKLAKSLVNIHGQHDSQALLNPEMHCGYIDILSKNNNILLSYKQSFLKLINVRHKLKALTAVEDDKDKQLELLNYQIDELENADIKIGEKDELLQKKAIIESSEEIKKALQKIKDLMSGENTENGLLDTLFNIKNILSSLKAKSKNISETISLLEDAEDLLCEIKENVNKENESIYFDENERDTVEERLEELFKLENKYTSGEENLINYLNEIKEKRNSILYNGKELEQLNDEYDVLYDETLKKAELLSNERKKTASKFEHDVKEELKFLEMPKISFKVDFKKGNLSSNGYDKVEFLISANPGEEEKSLSKIASGGELSRIMLAFKNILAHNDNIDTLIFDEIDTGVSGKASGKIGLKLKSLSKEAQVIVVTHSAQIAAFADRHLLIEKEFKNKRTYTKVTTLDFDGRVQELARIIGGLNITESMLQSAKELLQNSNLENNKIYSED